LFFNELAKCIFNLEFEEKYWHQQEQQEKD
jgi:hypothetical protein